METWREIPNTNGEYQASSNGRIMTTKSGRILTPVVDDCGYERVCLFKADRRKRHKVHRLIAMTFLPNPFSKSQVNHKDGNKRNNNVENLEWATNKENMRHSRENGLHDGHKKYCESKRKRIVAIHMKSGREIVFDSILSAKRTIGSNHIQDVLSGKRREAKGYTFRYAKEVMPDAYIDSKPTE